MSFVIEVFFEVFTFFYFSLLFGLFDVCLRYSSQCSFVVFLLFVAFGLGHSCRRRSSHLSPRFVWSPSLLRPNLFFRFLRPVTFCMRQRSFGLAVEVFGALVTHFEAFGSLVVFAWRAFQILIGAHFSLPVAFKSHEMLHSNVSLSLVVQRLAVGTRLARSVVFFGQRRSRRRVLARRSARRSPGCDSGRLVAVPALGELVRLSDAQSGPRLSVALVVVPAARSVHSSSLLVRLVS